MFKESVVLNNHRDRYHAAVKEPHMLFVDVVPRAAVEDARQNMDPSLQGAAVLKQYAPAY